MGNSERMRQNPTRPAILVAGIQARCKKDRRGTVKRWIPRFKAQFFTGLEITVIESSHGWSTSERTRLHSEVPKLSEYKTSWKDY